MFIRFEYVEDGKVGILALVWHEVRALESALWLRADDGVEGNGFRASCYIMRIVSIESNRDITTQQFFFDIKHEAQNG